MDTQNKLSSYLGENVNQEGGITRQEPEFTAFMNLFGINLVHRYPGVLDLDSIEVPVIQSIARFSLVCSRVATDVWTDTVSQREVRTRRSPQTRAA